MSNKTIKFIGAIAIQLVVIFSIIIYKTAIITSGTPVILQILPVDPTDMFRGDYATFTFKISSISKYNFAYSPVKTGDVVYVPLVQVYDSSAYLLCAGTDSLCGSSGKLWGAGSNIRKIKPSSGVFLKGTVVSGNEVNQTNSYYDPPIQIKYGIEQYFIPQGQGRGLGFGNQNATAKVIIDDNGNAVIKQVYVNGREWPQEKIQDSSTSLNNPFQSSANNDALRLAHVRQIQAALELFFNDNGRYPEADTNKRPSTTAGLSPYQFYVYLSTWPRAPTPPDGNCTTAQNTYTYVQGAKGEDYSLSFCLGNSSGGFSAGMHTASSIVIQ